MLTPIVRSPPKHQDNNRRIYTVPRGDPSSSMDAASVTVTPQEPCSQLILRPCSPFVLDFSGFYNCSLPSSVGFPELHLLFGCGFLYLLPSAVEGSPYENDWARHRSMSTAESHQKSFFFWSLMFGSVLELLASRFQLLAIGAVLGMDYLSWHEHQVRSVLGGHFHKLEITIAPAHTVVRIGLKMRICGWICAPVPQLGAQPNYRKSPLQALQPPLLESFIKLISQVPRSSTEPGFLVASKCPEFQLSFPKLSGTSFPS